MYKEKRIKEMAKDLDEHCDAFVFGFSVEIKTIEFAEKLYNAGYGNVKQAVKEFAEKLKAVYANEADSYMIDKIFKELYGEDE